MHILKNNKTGLCMELFHVVAFNFKLRQFRAEAGSGLDVKFQRSRRPCSLLLKDTSSSEIDKLGLLCMLSIPLEKAVVSMFLMLQYEIE